MALNRTSTAVMKQSLNKSNKHRVMAVADQVHHLDNTEHESQLSSIVAQLRLLAVS